MNKILVWTLVGIAYVLMLLAGHAPSWGGLYLGLSAMAFSLLIGFAIFKTYAQPVLPTVPSKVKRLARVGLIALLVQFLLGAIVRRITGGLACPNFPSCADSFFPSPFSAETLIAFLHRWWGILMIGLFFHLAVATMKTLPELAKVSKRTFSLAVAQIFLGIGTVMSGLNTGSRDLHAAVGYALWGLLLFTAVRAGVFTTTSQEAGKS